MKLEEKVGRWMESWVESFSVDARTEWMQPHTPAPVAVAARDFVSSATVLQAAEPRRLVPGVPYTPHETGKQL